jgi:phosphoglucosamine mutase
MLEAALQAGFTSMGMDVMTVGPMPTPAVAMLTRSLRADIGVMISASHNPYEDNGIKLFGPDGFKLSDEVEAAIERIIDAGPARHVASSEDIGRARHFEDARGRYVEFAKYTFPRNLRLGGLKIVIDCANGAAYNVAPQMLYELGATVETLAVEPDGTNINAGVGATAPAAMQELVTRTGADLGISLDGDADRVVISDEKGNLLDGDQLMALIARYWKSRDQLRGGGLVATVMSNLGLEHFLQGEGLTLARTKVGDRYVLEHMKAHGFNVGGEQSGHIILTDYSTTGDGMIAALQVLAVLVRADRRMSELGNIFQPYPQILRNVRFNGGQPLEADTVKAAIGAGEARLGDLGRVVIRKSGTEPLIRVMAEGQDEQLVSSVVDEIVGAIAQIAA